MSEWLPPPERGTAVCGGFDGSQTDDTTAIKLETRDGLLFTPRYGPDGLPTIWSPAEWGGSVPRDQVRTAWAEITETYAVERVYCDPWMWQSEIESWDRDFGGGDVFIGWHTNRVTQMHAALDRFVTDVNAGALRHDGCPVTATHVGNARRLPKPGDRYVLGKPSQAQKIDVAMASVIAHEAAADARAVGWYERVDSTMWVWG